MIKMPLTVLSGSIANSPGSIGISLTGMHGTFLLSEFFFFFNKHACSSNTNPHRAAEKNMTTGQKKRFLREMHFLASAEKLYILGQGEDVLENV